MYRMDSSFFAADQLVYDAADFGLGQFFGYAQVRAVLGVRRPLVRAVRSNHAVGASFHVEIRLNAAHCDEHSRRKHYRGL